MLPNIMRSRLALNAEWRRVGQKAQYTRKPAPMHSSQMCSDNENNSSMLSHGKDVFTGRIMMPKIVFVKQGSVQRVDGEWPYLYWHCRGKQTSTAHLGMLEAFCLWNCPYLLYQSHQHIFIENSCKIILASKASATQWTNAQYKDVSLQSHTFDFLHIYARI